MMGSLMAQENAQAPVALTPVAPKVDLEQAYKREYLFLTAQKRELSERLTRYEKSTKAEIQKSSKQIEVLEKKYLALTRMVEKESANLSESERNLETLEGEKEALDTMLERSSITINEINASETSGADNLEAETIDVKLAKRFQGATNILRHSGSVTKKSGEFFLKDGQKTTGTLISLGRAATYGLSDSGAYLLAPSGRGELKVWEQTNAENVKKLAQGNFEGSLETYLHESSNKEVTQKEGKTFSDIMKAGGAIGWVIFGLGIATLIMVGIRALLIYMAGKDSETLVTEVTELISKGQKSTAKEKLVEGGVSKSAITRLVSVIVKSDESDKAVLEDMASEQMIKEWAVIDKFGTLIIVAASVAPLLGLLGTVTGMIATFDIITEFGTGDPKMLSSGISEALVTTMMGLIVAIPALMLGSVLSAQSDKIKSKMEQTALALLNALSMAKN